MVPGPDRAGVGEFLARLLRLDPQALVRLRPDSEGGRIWAMLPFRVLVCRRLVVAPASDVTVAAADLRAWLEASPSSPGSEQPRRRDSEWRWPLPSSEGRVVETIPVAELVRLAAAAARTVRTATAEGVGGRAVGERALRDAMLDHIAIVVTTESGAGQGEDAVPTRPDPATRHAGGAERVEIPQRMVQAFVRMALPAGVAPNTFRDSQVTVSLAMGWIGLSSPYGSAWYRPISPLHFG